VGWCLPTGFRKRIGLPGIGAALCDQTIVRLAIRLREPKLEEEAIEIARQLGRDHDPISWQRKHFDLLAVNAQPGRERDMWQGMALVCLLVGGALFLLKWLFHW
jgi:hypothetical protein